MIVSLMTSRPHLEELFCFRNQFTVPTKKVSKYEEIKGDANMKIDEELYHPVMSKPIKRQPDQKKDKTQVSLCYCIMATWLATGYFVIDH